MYQESIEQIINWAEDALYDGDLVYARKLLYSALEDEPGYARLHFTIGWMYHYYYQNYNQAEHYYKWAIHFDSRYADAFVELNRLYNKLGWYGKVITLMKKAAEIESIDQEYINCNLAIALERKGHFQEALRYYRKALMCSLDVDSSKELRQHIKRAKLKKLKVIWKI